MEQRNCVLNRSLQSKEEATVLSGIVTYSLTVFSVTHIADFASSAWPSSLYSLNTAHNFCFFYFIFGRVAEFPRKSVSKRFVLFLVVCASVFGKLSADYSYDLASDSEDMLHRISNALLCLFRTFISRRGRTVISLRQSIHCLIA